MHKFWHRARRQGLAAGGPKTRKRGQKPEGGAHFKIQYWMYAATGGPNVKWGCTDFKWGPGTTDPPAGDGPVRHATQTVGKRSPFLST